MICAPGVVVPACGDTLVQPYPQPWAGLPDAVYTVPPRSARNTVMIPSGASTAVMGAPGVEGAENLRHLGKGPAERGGAFGMRRAGPGPTGGGMIFGLWA